MAQRRRRGCAATCATRWTSADFPGRSAATRSASTAGSICDSRGDNTRTSGGRRLFIAVVARVRLRGAGRTTTDTTAISPARSATSEAFSRRWNGRCQLGLRRVARASTSRRGMAAPAGTGRQHLHHRRLSAGSAGRRDQRRATSPKAAGPRSERVFVTAGLRVDDIRRERASRSHRIRSRRRPRAAGRHGRVGQPAARRAALDRALGRFRLHQASAARSAPASVRPTASSSRSPTIPACARAQHQRAKPASITPSPAATPLAEATVFTNHYDDLIVAVGSFAGASRFRDRQHLERARQRPRAGAHGARPGSAWGGIDLAARSATPRSTRRSSRSIRTTDAPPPFDGRPGAAAAARAPVLRGCPRSRAAG